MGGRGTFGTSNSTQCGLDPGALSIALLLRFKDTKSEGMKRWYGQFTQPDGGSTGYLRV